MVARSEERRVGKECRSRCDWSSDVCSSDLITIANPNHPIENTFKALGNNKLIINRDMDLSGTGAGGIFFSTGGVNMPVRTIGMPSQIGTKPLAHEWWQDRKSVV